LRRLVLWFVRLLGWRMEGELPAVPKYVAIGVPHTSNLDFVFFLAVTTFFHMPAKVIGKHTLVRWPFGGLMRRWGVIPVRRDAPGGVVGEAAAALRAADEAVLVIAPEGTRSAAPYWKSGFYRIALEAEVPILLAFVDYRRKRTGVGPLLHPTGDVRADMDVVRAFYDGITGRHPEGQGPIRLREETQGT
jgi:1-acyl-sn-glycerol-3-phosphate acyltransferase